MPLEALGGVPAAARGIGRDIGSGREAALRYAVLRHKNRYKEPLFNGYRDALYSVALETADGGVVVCEVHRSWFKPAP